MSSVCFGKAPFLLEPTSYRLPNSYEPLLVRRRTTTASLLQPFKEGLAARRPGMSSPNPWAFLVVMGFIVTNSVYLSIDYILLTHSLYSSRLSFIRSIIERLARGRGLPHSPVAQRAGSGANHPSTNQFDMTDNANRVACCRRATRRQTFQRPSFQVDVASERRFPVHEGLAAPTVKPLARRPRLPQFG